MREAPVVVVTNSDVDALRESLATALTGMSVSVDHRSCIRASFAPHIADVLLPVVLAFAAGQLRKAANDVHMPYKVRMALHARADVLSNKGE